MEVIDQSGEMERAWVADNATFKIANRAVNTSGPSGPAFLLRKKPGVYWIHTGEISMPTSDVPIPFLLVDEKRGHIIAGPCSQQ